MDVSNDNVLWGYVNMATFGHFGLGRTIRRFVNSAGSLPIQVCHKLLRTNGATCHYLSTDRHVEKPVDADVKLSASCIKQLKRIAVDSNFLRVMVEGGGCSGFQYKFQLDDVINKDDRVIEQEGVKVIIDSDSVHYLKGATIDYHEEMIRSAFRVLANPQAELGCSCGASFSLKL